MSRLQSATLHIGDPAPPLALVDLDGKLVQLADLLELGPTLMIFGPGSWSPATRQQVADLNQMHEAFTALGLSILVVVTESSRTARRMVPMDGPLFPILIDEDRDAARDYGVYRAFSLDGIGVTRPAAFLVDRSGVLRFVYVGQRAADVPEVAGLLQLSSWLVEPNGHVVVEDAEAAEAAETGAAQAEGVREESDGEIRESGDATPPLDEQPTTVLPLVAADYDVSTELLGLAVDGEMRADGDLTGYDTPSVLDGEVPTEGGDGAQPVTHPDREGEAADDAPLPTAVAGAPLGHEDQVHSGR